MSQVPLYPHLTRQPGNPLLSYQRAQAYQNAPYQKAPAYTPAYQAVKPPPLPYRKAPAYTPAYQAVKPPPLPYRKAQAYTPAHQVTQPDPPPFPFPRPSFDTIPRKPNYDYWSEPQFKPEFEKKAGYWKEGRPSPVIPKAVPPVKAWFGKQKTMLSKGFEKASNHLQKMRQVSPVRETAPRAMPWWYEEDMERHKMQQERERERRWEEQRFVRDSL